MDSRLPRNRRALWIGLIVTVTLHLALFAYLILWPNKVRVPPMLIYFTPRLELAPPDADVAEAAESPTQTAVD